MMSLLTAVMLAAASYAVLGGIDALGARYAGAPVRWWKAALGGAAANAISNTVGFSAVSGSAIRLRLWRRWNATTAQAAVGTTFALSSLWVGMIGATTLARGRPDGTLGWTVLLLCIAYVTWAIAGAPTLSLRSITFRPPPVSLALGQLALASADWLLAAAVMFVLLPAHAISYPEFATLFFVAAVAGMVSHLPAASACSTQPSLRRSTVGCREPHSSVRS